MLGELPPDVAASDLPTEGQDEVLVLDAGGPEFKALRAKGAAHPIEATGRDLRKLMARRMSVTGTMLRARPHEAKAAAVQAFAREVVPHLASGRMRAVVDAVVPWEQAVAAFDRLAAPGKLGKVLLDFGP